MTVTWDTTLVSRIYPGGRLERHLLDRAGEDFKVLTDLIATLYPDASPPAVIDPPAT